VCADEYASNAEPTQRGKAQGGRFCGPHASKHTKAPAPETRQPAVRRLSRVDKSAAAAKLAAVPPILDRPATDRAKSGGTCPPVVDRPASDFEQSCASLQ